MNQKLQNKINNQYLENEDWSFGGIDRVFDGNKESSTKKEIKKILSSNDIYTKYRRHKKARKYSPIFVYKKRELFQADVVFFTDPEFVKDNNGYKYLVFHFICLINILT